METAPHDESSIFDLRAGGAQGGRRVEAALTLAHTQARVRVRLPDGEPGRAEARLPDGRNWAAKHYWREPDGSVVYEFDQALPVGPLQLVVPLERSMR